MCDGVKVSSTAQTERARELFPTPLGANENVEVVVRGDVRGVHASYRKSSGPVDRGLE